MSLGMNFRMLGLLGAIAIASVAWGQPAARSTGPALPEVEKAAQTVSELQSISSANDLARLGELIDVTRMHAEMRRQNVVDWKLDAAAETFVRQCAARRLINDAEREGWQAVRIQRTIPRDDDLLCLAQFDGAAGKTRKMLWLNRSQGRWRIYDWQDVRDVFRASTELGAFWDAMNGGTRSRGFLDLLAVSRLPVEEPGTALTMLAQMDDGDLPPILQSARWTLAAHASVNLGEIAAALAALERAESFGDSTPARLYLLARIHASVGDAERGLQLAEQALQIPVN